MLAWNVIYALNLKLSKPEISSFYLFTQVIGYASFIQNPAQTN